MAGTTNIIEYAIRFTGAVRPRDRRKNGDYETKILNEMKKIVLTAILALSAAWAVAQDDGNRDAYGKIVRGPYETNRFFDNILSVWPAA